MLLTKISTISFAIKFPLFISSFLLKHFFLCKAFVENQIAVKLQTMSNRSLSNIPYLTLIFFTELENVDKAEVERIAGNMRKDMNSIEADLDDLLEEGTYVGT